MTGRRAAAAILLGLAPLLGSCGGASENGFSAYVADHWPHWAGGMPADVPPRPGAPGYNEFIAHGQAGQNVTTPAAPAAPAGKPAAIAVQPAPVAMEPAAAAGPAPVAPADTDNPPSDDSSVTKGGLY